MDVSHLPYNRNLWEKYCGIVCLTNETKQYFRGLNNAVVIPNSLPFYPENNSLCENKKIISVGRTWKIKGYDLLLEAWNLIAKKYPDWSIEIYGEARNLDNYLREKIATYKLEKSFLLKGAELNIKEKYLDSSIYVMSSRSETFGMVLLEAMACGLPVVSFDCPTGPRNIIKDGEDGFLVQNGNIQEMADKLSYLISNEDIRKEMGQKARQNIQRFSQDNIMPQWKALFEEMKNESVE